ncbi:dehydrogenase [Brenneria sp. EniD312]|uniref:aldehyde dehydrogenase family protein n=1 Tax=Brenneria sp. EniD312 TaxID=598467 RepID=UPI00022F7B0D|nr:aldehyde dehydrogenase family protein [Brenneria sp. EniD312]EHD22120.1 dehydrogenase [Brenneria sp. EniD312]
MNIKKINIWRTRHANLLEKAVTAVNSREPFNPFPDDLSFYDKSSIQKGEIQFRQLLGSRFEMEHREKWILNDKRISPEISPYGFPLRISYFVDDFDKLVKKSNHAMKKWEKISINARAAIMCEAITRIHNATFLFSNIGMHTSGHSFFMGFHANAIHAQARALESVANIYNIERGLHKELYSNISIANGVQQHIQRTFKPYPIGLSLIYSGQLVPTWGAYPAIFASLTAGCPVIIIPHSNAILPIALTVRIIKSVFIEAGIPHDIISLFCSENEDAYQAAAIHRSVKLIDYMGGAFFGNWLKQHTLQARVMSQQNAYTSVFVHSVNNYKGMIENLAFGLCSYSAQLCTSPQNIYVLESGIFTPDRIVTPKDFQRDLVKKINYLIKKHPKPRELLGAIASEKTINNIELYSNNNFGQVILHSKRIEDPDFSGARITTPLVISVTSSSEDIRDNYAKEISGPISFIIMKDNLKNVIEELRYSAKNFGILGVGLYTIDDKVENAMRHVSSEIGALLSINFCNNYYISQCSIFTDIHGSACNPSSNIIYGTPDFYNYRLRLTESRKVL